MTNYGADMDIPNTYAGYEVGRDLRSPDDLDLSKLPPGYTVAWVSDSELRAAGFHGGPDAEAAPTREPGTAPLDELLVPGAGVVEVPTATLTEAIDAGRMRFLVLVDAFGRTVATWDEGRWWTPEESDAFMDMILRGREA